MGCVGGLVRQASRTGAAHTPGWRDSGRKSLGQRSAQFGTADARQCAQTDASDYTRLVALDSGGESGGVDLVHDPDLRHALGADFLQHRVHGGGLLVATRVRGVDDVQQEIGLGGRRRASRETPRRDRAAARG